MADDEEQRRREEMVNDFKYRAKKTKELIDGDIYCVFHFPDHRGSNEDEIMRYNNTASVRVFLHQYQEENSDVFFFSTNRDDLVVDPDRDPNKLRPILGSSEPPYPTNPKDATYWQRRNHWKTRFEWELFVAVGKGGESLGDIYYRWFHIDSYRHSMKYPNPKRTENTEAVRKVLKEEKIRHPHEFFFSCDKEDLTVDMLNPTLPPRMGSLFPADKQPQASTSGIPGLTGEPRTSAPSTVSVPPGSPSLIYHSPPSSRGPPTKKGKFGSKWPADSTGPSTSMVRPLPIAHSPHILGATVPSVYLSPSLSSSGTAMPELILPPTAMITTDVTNTSTSAHSFTADKLLSDLNEIITDPPVNQEGFNEIMGDLDAMPGVNAGDLYQVIALPPANQEADYNMIGEAEQLLGSEALFAPLPVMDEPLDDDENAMVDDIDEDDEHVGDIGGMDHSIIEEHEDDAEEAREQSDAIMIDTSEADIDLESDDDYSYIGHDEQKIMFYEFR